MEAGPRKRQRVGDEWVIPVLEPRFVPTFFTDRFPANIVQALSPVVVFNGPPVPPTASDVARRMLLFEPWIQRFWYLDAALARLFAGPADAAKATEFMATGPTPGALEFMRKAPMPSAVLLPDKEAVLTQMRRDPNSVTQFALVTVARINKCIQKGNIDEARRLIYLSSYAEASQGDKSIGFEASALFECAGISWDDRMFTMRGTGAGWCCEMLNSHGTSQDTVIRRAKLTLDCIECHSLPEVCLEFVVPQWALGAIRGCPSHNATFRAIRRALLYAVFPATVPMEMQHRRSTLYAAYLTASKAEKARKRAQLTETFEVGRWSKDFMDLLAAIGAKNAASDCIIAYAKKYLEPFFQSAVFPPVVIMDAWFWLPNKPRNPKIVDLIAELSGGGLDLYSAVDLNHRLALAAVGQGESECILTLPAITAFKRLLNPDVQTEEQRWLQQLVKNDKLLAQLRQAMSYINDMFASDAWHKRGEEVMELLNTLQSLMHGSIDKPMLDGSLANVIDIIADFKETVGALPSRCGKGSAERQLRSALFYYQCSPTRFKETISDAIRIMYITKPLDALAAARLFYFSNALRGNWDVRVREAIDAYGTKLELWRLPSNPNAAEREMADLQYKQYITQEVEPPAIDITATMPSRQFKFTPLVVHAPPGPEPEPELAPLVPEPAAKVAPRPDRAKLFHRLRIYEAMGRPDRAAIVRQQLENTMTPEGLERWRRAAGSRDNKELEDLLADMAWSSGGRRRRAPSSNRGRKNSIRRRRSKSRSRTPRGRHGR